MRRNNITQNTRKQIVVDDFLISVPCSHLELCLVHFYENSFDSGTRKVLVNAFWSLISASASIFLMLISTDCKKIGPLSQETVTTIVVIFLLALLVGVTIIGIILSTKTFKENRNEIIKTAINEIASGRRQSDFESISIYEFD